jgi:O-antigen ligase
MHFANVLGEGQTSMAMSVRIAAIALGMSILALLNSRGAFAAAVAVGGLAMVSSPGFAETSRHFRRAVVTPPVLLAAAVLVAWLPSTILSSFPWVSIQVLARMVLFLVFGVWVYAFFLERPRALDLLLKTLIIGSAFGVVVANVGIWAFPDLMVLIKGQAAVDAKQASLMVKAFASASVMLIPFELWAGWRLGGRWKGAAAVLSLALLVLIGLADSRAGMAGLLGVVGGALLASMARKEPRWQAVGFALILIVAGTAILVFLADRNQASMLPERLLSFPPWLVDPHRQLIWRYALDLAALSPWTGWGINTINLVPPPPGMSAIAFGIPAMPSHPHNWILEVFAETGVIGGIPMLIAVTVSFVAAVRRYRLDGDLRFMSVVSTSGAFWVSGLFNFSFWSAWWQVSYILMVAFLCAAKPVSDGTEVRTV